MKGLTLSCIFASVLGDIQIAASTVAPYGSSTTDVPSDFPNANSLNYTYSQGLAVSYYEYGDASNPTLIVTGGWPPSAYIYNDIAATLATRGVHVVLYDQRGFGKSAHPWGPWDYSITNLANEMGAVIDAVAPNKSVIVGGDTWSPFIASEYCDMYPNSHRIEAIMSIGCPSFDLAAQTLIDQTRNLVSDQQNLTEIIGQWIALSYELEISIPVIPEILALTNAPGTFIDSVQNGLYALNNSNADALADILGSELSRQLLLDFSQHSTSNTDTAHGEQKYQWYIDNRMIPGIISGKMYRQYLPVEKLKVFQLRNDTIETDLLIQNLGEHTPSLNLTYLDGTHWDFLQGDNSEIIIDTFVEWLYDM